MIFKKAFYLFLFFIFLEDKERVALFLCQAKGEHRGIVPPELCAFPGELLLLFSHGFMSEPFATPWTAACQASLSMRFPRQEYWSGLPFPSPLKSFLN